MEHFSRRRWRLASAKAVGFKQYIKNYEAKNRNIPYMFDNWANLVVQLLPLKSSMGKTFLWLMPATQTRDCCLIIFFNIRFATIIEPFSIVWMKFSKSIELAYFWLFLRGKRVLHLLFCIRMFAYCSLHFRFVQPNYSATCVKFARQLPFYFM